MSLDSKAFNEISFIRSTVAPLFGMQLDKQDGEDVIRICNILYQDLDCEGLILEGLKA